MIFTGKIIKGAMSLEGITYQNDNFDWCKCQIMLVLPILLWSTYPVQDEYHGLLVCKGMYGEWKGHKFAAETPVDNIYIGTRKKHPDREYEANFSYGTGKKQETKIILEKFRNLALYY